MKLLLTNIFSDISSVTVVRYMMFSQFVRHQNSSCTGDHFSADISSVDVCFGL